MYIHNSQIFIFLPIFEVTHTIRNIAKNMSQFVLLAQKLPTTFISLLSTTHHTIFSLRDAIFFYFLSLFGVSLFDFIVLSRLSLCSFTPWSYTRLNVSVTPDLTRDSIFALLCPRNIQERTHVIYLGFGYFHPNRINTME